MDNDAVWMRRALALAETAAREGETPVGAVLTSAQGEIIGAAANAPIALSDPTAHAEVLALRAACAQLGNYRLPAGTTLFVTLEPCAMCAGAIAQARVSRLVFGATDEKGGAVVSGARFFEQPICHWRPHVEGGVLAPESAALLRNFFRARR
ncbi:MAG: nucleoside deaminase [Alphaproteobacteria bacterium]|nr:nucleoside deaminase [Alphaproteobacteria bacterium]